MLPDGRARMHPCRAGVLLSPPRPGGGRGWGEVGGDQAMADGFCRQAPVLVSRHGTRTKSWRKGCDDAPPPPPSLSAPRGGEGSLGFHRLLGPHVVRSEENTS